MEKPLTRPFFIRNLDAGKLLETFLVSAVAAFLGVRFFLGVTGYPPHADFLVGLNAKGQQHAAMHDSTHDAAPQV